MARSSPLPRARRALSLNDVLDQLGAISAIADLGDQDSVVVLVALLDHANQHIRLASARALTVLHARRAYPSLVRAAKRETSEHRQKMLEASEALREGRDVAMDSRYVSAAAPSNVLVARAEREKGEQGDERADERSWHRRQNEREHVPTKYALLVSTGLRSHERRSSLSSAPRDLRRPRRDP